MRAEPRVGLRSLWHRYGQKSTRPEQLNIILLHVNRNEIHAGSMETVDGTASRISRPPEGSTLPERGLPRVVCILSRSFCEYKCVFFSRVFRCSGTIVTHHGFVKASNTEYCNIVYGVSLLRMKWNIQSMYVRRSYYDIFWIASPSYEWNGISVINWYVKSTN